MTLTKHAMRRIVERNKAASYMTFKQLQSLINSSEIIVIGTINAILLKSIDLVLIVNTLNGKIVTAYNFSTSKFNA